AFSARRVWNVSALGPKRGGAAIASAWGVCLALRERACVRPGSVGRLGFRARTWWAGALGPSCELRFLWAALHGALEHSAGRGGAAFHPTLLHAATVARRALGRARIFSLAAARLEAAPMGDCCGADRRPALAARAARRAGGAPADRRLLGEKHAAIAASQRD